MNYETLKSTLSISPTIRLLRAKNAPLIISFLFRAFKERSQIVVAQYELVNRLSDYLEYLNDAELQETETDLVRAAEKLIQTWSDEDHRYLRRYPSETGEPLIELTSHTEKAFQWIEMLQNREFVGTESRFLNISQQLQEIIQNTSEDPRQKIEELERQRKELTAQIRKIKQTGKVFTYNDTQIKERFFNLTRTARELVSDFKEVEQNFKDISLNIYKKQTKQDIDRGQIVGYTLDSTDELKSSDQGRSFYAFWQFLIADNRQDELRQMIEQVHEVLDERGIEANDNFLKKIKFYLQNAGQKVLDSNHLIAEKLSRILAEQDLAERKRTRELINEIKNKAVQKVGKLQGKRAFIHIEGIPEINMPLDRPLGEKPQVATFDVQPESVSDSMRESLDLSVLFDQFELDKKHLEDNILALLKTREEVRLEEVVAQYPIQKGIAEVIAYLSIASSEKQHSIDRGLKIPIDWEEETTRKKAFIPEVIYRNEFA